MVAPSNGGLHVYGMIYRAAREFAIDRLGEPFWTGFAEANGLTEAAFITAQSYPDEVTFSVIAGLAEAAAMTQSELLEAFGVYWVDYARRGPHANMLGLGGKTLPAFLGNLNRMHASLAMAMPGSRMPSFFVLSSTNERLRVNYVSSRKGLEPFVRGLLEGLCAMFATEADVIFDPEAPETGAVFEIRYRAAAAA